MCTKLVKFVNTLFIFDRDLFLKEGESLVKTPTPPEETEEEEEEAEERPAPPERESFISDLKSPSK